MAEDDYLGVWIDPGGLRLLERLQGALVDFEVFPDIEATATVSWRGMKVTVTPFGTKFEAEAASE